MFTMEWLLDTFKVETYGDMALICLLVVLIVLMIYTCVWDYLPFKSPRKKKRDPYDWY